MIALVFLLVAQAPGDAELERVAFTRIEELHAAAVPEPEPPPGLRAERGTERHATALKNYGAAFRSWERAEARRGDDLIRLAGEFVARFPSSTHRGSVYRRLGCVHLDRGAFGPARKALETALSYGDEQARAPLVHACRGLGDYRAAVKHGGPDPELLEEAGRVGDAIRAALQSGRPDLAAAWRQIGCEPKFDVAIPAGCRALVIEAGKRLDPVLKQLLQTRYGKRGLRFQEGPKKEGSIFLTDAKACISAVSPREDTWKFRISRLLGAD